MKEPSSILLDSRRCIEEFSQIELIDDLTWDNFENYWFLHIKIQLCSESIQIPEWTEWYIVLSDKYPEGALKIYPSVKNGIFDTFYHQANNGVKSLNGLWRKGNVCLTDPFSDITGLNQEPCDINRLKWNVDRLIIWIDRANRNTLISPDDFFELPYVITRDHNILIFDEDEVSYMEWESSGKKCGTFSMIFQGNKKIFIKNFDDINGKICRQTSWGEYVSQDIKSDYFGIWILLNEIPVINRWQVPNTYRELKEALEHQGLDLRKVLAPLLNTIRDGLCHPLLIGFPVPKKFGGENVCYHWWSCMLPPVSYKNQIEKGFRANNAGWLHRDFLKIFRDSMELNWSITENWNHRQIMNRGMIESSIYRNRFMIIGAGSLGSLVAEQLIRAGVYNISVMDNDLLSVGNLSRHTLTLDEVYRNKAIALVEHLNKINCHVRAKAFNCYINELNIHLLEDYDIIIDCTAKDNILKLLTNLKKSKIIYSMSVGYKAERLYVLYNNGCELDLNSFYERVDEYITYDKEHIEKDGLPWDGIGCWNPVFPAYSYDMQLASSVATMLLTDLIKNKYTGTHCFIYQKKINEDGIFIGYDRI